MAAAEATSAYSRAEKAKRELDALLEQISNQKGVQPSVADQQRLGALSNQLASTVEEVRQQADGLSDVKNRVVWQRKAERLEADAELVREAVDKQLGQYFKAKRQHEDREKLFGRGHDEQKASSGPDDAMRDMLKENRGLRDAGSELDRIIEQGRSTFGNLIDQNKMLKNARKKILDVASAMGVSQSLVNVIDRRNKEDKWLVYGGMTLVLFILFSLWYLLRK
mmetsp:Transcript_49009/g.131549  ORF Transcript_49009/g.131549 Transcript_49009/m.131549 type:complete len:223 (-) Transcript_49009:76-744(-)